MAKRERPTPIPLEGEEKDFVDGWYWKFLTEKATRGAKVQENAQKWTTETFIPMFLAECYAEMDNEERKAWSVRADYVSRYAADCVEANRKIYFT